LSIEEKALPPLEGIAKITSYTEWFVEFMGELAISHNM